MGEEQTDLTGRELLFERVGDVGVLTLNRPGRLNALSTSMIEEVLKTMRTLSEECSLRALVITGAGRGFCSGADLAGGDGDQRLEDSAGSLGKTMRQGLNPLLMAITEAPFPIVAAVNGPAAGAGVGIALAADFMIASSTMQLLLTFSRIGMGLDGGTSWFLSRQLGQRRAAAISMLVEPITAEDAKDWGAQKRQLREALEIPLAEALDREAEVQDGLIKTQDLKEGIASFRERRPAKYLGR